MGKGKNADIYVLTERSGCSCRVEAVGTIDEFIKANRNDPDTVAKIKKLKRGETLHLGGGALTPFVMERHAPSQLDAEGGLWLKPTLTDSGYRGPEPDSGW
jgi:hypothetical protein